MVAAGDKSRKFAFMEIRFKLSIFRIGTTCINMATQNKYGVKDYRIRHRMLPYMDCGLQCHCPKPFRIRTNTGRLLPYLDCVLPFCLLRRMKRRKSKYGRTRYVFVRILKVLAQCVAYKIHSPYTVPYSVVLKNSKIKINKYVYT